MADTYPSFTVLIAVGGKPVELDRLADTLNSLACYEPAVERIVVVDDFQGRFDVLACIPSALIGRVVVLPNPRNGRGSGWGAGLAAGILHGLRWIAEHTTDGFVLKMDTDSLVINAFAQTVAARFASHPGAGLLGSYTKTPNRLLDKPEDVPAAPALRKLSRWFTVWRRTYYRWPHIQCSLFQRANKVRRVILAAVANGYQLGRHCQGGGYAVSRAALRTFHHAGLLDDPLTWLWTPCSEDLVVTLLAAAIGFPVADFNDDGQPFGVKAQGLADSPARLVERGFAIIHSVKDNGVVRETETREFFHRRRNTVSPA